MEEKKVLGYWIHLTLAMKWFSTRNVIRNKDTIPGISKMRGCVLLDLFGVRPRTEHARYSPTSLIKKISIMVVVTDECMVYAQ